MIRPSARLTWLALGPLLGRGNRWTRMAARRQEAAFWLMRDRLDRVWLKFLGAVLRRRRFVGEGVTALMVLTGIVRAILIPVLAAGGVVVLLVWCDQAFSSVLLDRLWDAGRAAPLRSLLGSVEGASDAGAVELALGQSAEEAKAALLVAGAQVTGVFLGLYFTAISVVAGTAYGNVPPGLRSVLIEDQVGNIYLRVVGFTGGACLFGLGVLGLGYPLGAFSALVFSALGAASILSFIPLGKRVFRFLDPEAVTSSLARDVTSAVNSVAATGIFASNRSIQAHHQRVAAKRLDEWEELVSVSIGRAQSASALKISLF